jgi:hypothetical protein
MNYDKSKRIFNFRALTGLYELIDIAIGTVFEEVRDDDGEVVPNDNDKWRVGHRHPDRPCSSLPEHIFVDRLPANHASFPRLASCVQGMYH